MKLNAAWHKKHRMPKNATDIERLRWHLEHQKQCACRPIPPRLAAMVQKGKSTRR